MTSILVQGPALRAVPIAPCLHESSRGSLCSLERTGRVHSHLPRWLAHTGSVSGSVMRTGIWWKLHPQTVSWLGDVSDLHRSTCFASLETSHFQLFCSLSEGTLGTDALVHSWPWGLRKYVSNPVSLLALCKIREDEEQVLLMAPYWPTRTWFPGVNSPRDRPSLAD